MNPLRLISICLFCQLCSSILECQALKISSNKVSTIKNKNLNETEFKDNLIKPSYKTLNQMMCASNCNKISNCNLTVFDSKDKLCKHYFGFINYTKTKLIDAESINIFYNFKSEAQLANPPYVLKGVVINSILFSNPLYVCSLAVLKSGNLASGMSNGAISIWNSTNNFSLINTFQGHLDFVRDLLVLNNGDLVSGSANGTIKIWNTDNWSLKFDISGHSSKVNTLCLLSNGYIASGAYDGKLKIWNSNNGSLMFEKTLFSILKLIQLKNNDVLAGEQKIRILDSTNYNIKKFLANFTYNTAALLELKNGDVASNNGSTILIWDMISYTLKYNLTGHTGDINKIIQLKNGDLVSASDDKLVKVWSFSNNSWNCKLNLSSHQREVNGLIEFSNGYIASGSETIKIWS